MSKQRPSGTNSTERPTGQPAPGKRHLRPWLRRVFHNTYTRNGRRIALRGWAVKMQHQGERRNFPLMAPTRTGAAEEARALSEDIAAEGWESVVERYRGANRRAFRKTDIRHWKQRLLLRKNSFPEYQGRPPHYSARVEHAGVAAYFPLGSSNAEEAAARALAIYLAIIRKEWRFVRKRFPREVTVAFHWASDPLMWTYSTVHTLCGESDLRARSTSFPKAQNRIVLLEPDEELRGALQRCIGQHEDCFCEAFGSGSAVSRRHEQTRAALCLVNRDLAEELGLLQPARLAPLPDGTPALCYSAYADSEDLFAGTPGGMSGYLLKRSIPRQILEPIRPTLGTGPRRVEVLAHAARGYFRRIIEDAPAGKAIGGAGQLTPREINVLDLLSKGRGDKKIATALGISGWTVHEHLKRIFEKLGVHSRTEAVLAHLQK